MNKDKLLIAVIIASAIIPIMYFLTQLSPLETRQYNGKNSCKCGCHCDG